MKSYKICGAKREPGPEVQFSLRANVKNNCPLPVQPDGKKLVEAYPVDQTPQQLGRVTPQLEDVCMAYYADENHMILAIDQDNESAGCQPYCEDGVILIIESQADGDELEAFHCERYGRGGSVRYLAMSDSLSVKRSRTLWVRAETHIEIFEKNKQGARVYIYYYVRADMSLSDPEIKIRSACK